MRRRFVLLAACLLAGSPWRALDAAPLGNDADPFDTPAPPSGSPFRAEVLAAPDTVVSGAEAEIRVRLLVPEAHYVYAERTALEVLPVPGVELVGITAPTPKTKHDPFLEEEVQVYEHDADFTARVRVGWPATLRLVLATQGCSSAFCYFPQSDTLAVQVAVSGAPAVQPELRAPGTGAAAGGSDGEAAARLRAAADRGLVWVLLLAFGAGVATSFTPCVYPMIPITISIIGARSAGRRSKGFSLSLLYVLGIAVTYSALGTSAALTGSLFGSVLQNAWVLAGVALVFVLMAFSMFGAFELQVPSGFAGRMNRVQGSGYPGAFLLGLVAGVVASPCIGPVLVAMLAWVAASGSAPLGFAVFFTFALGLGVLFVVLGTFTGVLTSLPRSGAWMTRIKTGFGLLFLGLALYYLHPLLPHGRAMLAAGAALLAAGLACGALRHIDETEPKSRRWRKAAGRALAVAGVYALLVPMLAGRGPATGVTAGWVQSEAEGLQRARAEGKPMLVDFSASWCGACKELEHLTFADPRVQELATRFVTVRVDATTRTPEIDALMERYGIVGLPWVAFVTPGGEILEELTVTGFIDADAMLERMGRALPGGAVSNAAAP
jgi:thiol:disulfide interchange protein DsbD